MTEKDWVDDDGLSHDETMERFTALNPEPTEPGTLRRAVSREIAGTLLFADIGTKGDLRATADALADRVLRLIQDDLRIHLADIQPMILDRIEALRRGPDITGSSGEHGYLAGLDDAMRAVKGEPPHGY